MQSTVGGLWPASLSDAVRLSSNGSSRYLTIATQAQLQFLDKLAIIDGDIEADNLGLFSRLTIDPATLEARFAWLGDMGRGLFSDRTGCNVWAPKGDLRLYTDTVGTCPIQYQGQQCPDVLYGTCFEQIFGGGNNVRDWYATPESQAILNRIILAINRGLGNSLYQLIYFANHPTITSANTAGYWSTVAGTNATRWAEYLDQQTNSRITCSGIYTILDDLAAEGQPGYETDIPDGDFDSAGRYTGAESGMDIIEFLDDLIGRARGDFRVIARNGYTDESGVKRKPIIRLSDSLFNGYKQFIKTNFSHLPQAYRYTLTGSDGELITMPNVLEYDGFPIVRDEPSATFDSVVGTTSHRAIMAAPGVFGLAADVPSLQQYNGVGMRMVQKLDPPENGMVYMDTTLRIGMGIADPDFVVYRANIQEPA